MLTINLDYDANALAAPQSFRDGVQAAATILEAAILTPITVNIAVGYGEIDLGGPSYTPLTSNDSEGGVDDVIPVSYAALRTALAATESTAAGMAAVAALPNALSLDGKSVFGLPTALAKALGVIPATGTAVDGVIGFPTSFTGSGLVGTAIVEELHAMGLLNAGGDLGLFSYTSPGVHFLPSGSTATTPAYFSLDGGTTNLASYAVASDETLFQGQPNDPLDFPNQGTVLTAVDLQEISAIGFDDTSTPVLATPNLAPAVTAPGTQPVVGVQSVSVAQNGSVTALSLLKSVSVPLGDAIAYYGFDDSGTGGGHLSFNGLAEPDNQWVYVLDTELDELSYVGGTAAGSETIAVRAFDYPAGTYTQTASLTATTTSATTTSATATGGNGTAGTTPLDPAAIAINAAAVYGFANTGAPGFTAVVNQDGSADLALGAAALTGGFIGGYVAGIEIRVMANLEQSGGSTAAIDAQFGHDMDTLAPLLAPGTADVGFGFLSGLTTGGPSGLAGGSVPAGLQTDLRTALGADQLAPGAVGGGILGAVTFAQGYIAAVSAGQGPLAALHGIEASALA